MVKTLENGVFTQNCREAEVDLLASPPVPNKNQLPLRHKYFLVSLI